MYFEKKNCLCASSNWFITSRSRDIAIQIMIVMCRGLSNNSPLSPLNLLQIAYNKLFSWKKTTTLWCAADYYHCVRNNGWFICDVFNLSIFPLVIVLLLRSSVSIRLSLLWVLDKLHINPSMIDNDNLVHHTGQTKDLVQTPRIDVLPPPPQSYQMSHFSQSRDLSRKSEVLNKISWNHLILGVRALIK